MYRYPAKQFQHQTIPRRAHCNFHQDFDLPSKSTTCCCTLPANLAFSLPDDHWSLSNMLRTFLSILFTKLHSPTHGLIRYLAQKKVRLMTHRNVIFSQCKKKNSFQNHLLHQTAAKLCLKFLLHFRTLFETGLLLPLKISWNFLNRDRNYPILGAPCPIYATVAEFRLHPPQKRALCFQSASHSCTQGKFMSKTEKINWPFAHWRGSSSFFSDIIINSS